jgi:predicted metal-dependent hydrolase
MVEYKLIRSKRKTIALYVRGGGLEVRAPLRVSKQTIDRFVASKDKWIIKKTAELNERTIRRDSFTLGYGSLVIYRGKQYPIEARDGNRIGFDGTHFYMPPGLTHKRIKAACADIYRLLAKRDLTERVRAFAPRMAAIPHVVRVSGARTRSGS